MTPEIESFHWGSWAIWPPGAPWRSASHHVLKPRHPQCAPAQRKRLENVIFNEGEVIFMVIRVTSENQENAHFSRAMEVVRSIRWASKTCSGITTSDVDVIWHLYLLFLRP